MLRASATPVRPVSLLIWLGLDGLWVVLCWLVLPDAVQILAALGGVVGLHALSLLLHHRIVTQLGESVAHEAHLRGIIASSAHNIKHPVANALTLLVDLEQTAQLTDQQRLLLLDALRPKLESNLLLLDTRMRDLLEIARTSLVPHPVETIPTHALAARIETMITREHRGSRPPLQARVWVDGAETTIETMPMLVEGVIENLVNNAHAAQRELTVAVVDVRLVPTEHELRIYVTDHGPGFPPSMLTPTHDARSHAISNTFGSGLGLLGVQFVLRQLRGQMQLGNHPERGAQVMVVLPRSIGGSGCRRFL